MIRRKGDDGAAGEPHHRGGKGAAAEKKGDKAGGAAGRGGKGAAAAADVETHSSSAGERRPEGKESTAGTSMAVTPGMYVSCQRAHLSDRFQRVKKLGSGAYGEVLLCKDKLSGAERAIKIIKKTSVSASGNGNLLDEVAVLKQLDHPNIMKLYEVYEDKRNFYLVMELYTGGELFDEIISRQKFSEGDAAVIMQQVLSGCTYLHRHNIVHRDLKPENLLLESKSKDALVKIVDFGLSAHLELGGKMRERLGTAYYIAPEVLRKKYDEKCDVWSCGVILYILLCGYPPFGGQTDQEILKRVERGKYTFDPPDWTLVSEEAKNLVKLMLTFEPSKRISAEEALSHPWIVKLTSHKDEEVMGKHALTGALGNMRKFQSSQKLAQSALLFMGSKLTTLEETKELTQIFRQLDKNGDGQLDRRELIEGYRMLLDWKGETVSDLDESQIEAQVDQILQSVDFDQNGYIEYSEFVTVTMDRKLLLSRDRLLAAFQQFDSDHSGKITKEELGRVFGVAEVDAATWEEVLQECDKNNDGAVDFEEFVEMMQKICDVKVKS